MSNDKNLREPTGNGLALHGRRRVALIIAIVIAAALVAAGAVITVTNDLRNREVVNAQMGASASAGDASVPAGASTANPGQGANVAGDGGNGEGQGADAGDQGNGNRPDFVPGQPPPVAEAVGIDESATFTERVTAEVTKIESVEGEANGPGEIAGAALRISVTLTNQSQRPVDLDKSVVALFFGADDAPAAELSGPGVERFTGTLRNGDSASGVYVFRVPEDQRDKIRITVSYSPTDTAVAFEGSAQ